MIQKSESLVVGRRCSEVIARGCLDMKKRSLAPGVLGKGVLENVESPLKSPLKSGKAGVGDSGGGSKDVHRVLAVTGASLLLPRRAFLAPLLLRWRIVCLLTHCAGRQCIAGRSYRPWMRPVSVIRTARCNSAVRNNLKRRAYQALRGFEAVHSVADCCGYGARAASASSRR